MMDLFLKSRAHRFLLWISFGFASVGPTGISNLQAQTFEGIQNSNFSGVHSVYSNPALLTSMAYKRHANISTLGFEVNNNMFVITAPFTLWQVKQSLPPTNVNPF